MTTKSNGSNRPSFRDLFIAQLQNTDDIEALPNADESDWFLITKTARISIPFTREVFRLFLPFFGKMFVNGSSQLNVSCN